MEPFGETIYAFAAILLVSAGFFSFAGWYVRRMLRRQGMTTGVRPGGGAPVAPGLPISPAWPGGR